MRILSFFFLWWVIAHQLFAQAPVTNLYMFDLRRQGDTLFQFVKPRYLTYFNANGYNNHPFFASSDEVYFSSQNPQDEQPDIVRVSLRDSSLIKLTNTYEGEYSPRKPYFEYSNYYIVRMEFLGQDTLIRLWQVSNSGFGGAGSHPVFQNYTNVGYYEFITQRLVALHLNDTPNILALGIPETDNVTPIAYHIGRCFRLLPFTNNLIYLQKSSTGEKPMLMSIDLRSSANRPPAVPLVESVANSEDFALLNDGTILMAAGSRLYKFKPKADRTWVQIADFAEHNLTKITRLEVNRENNRIILVN
ncbi:MAG: hypothetical protein KIPDCIKN_03694 [Haliscomenobacter sp.]|nr:hypothetical protein [Haliscomenobacter sp.]